MMRAILFLIGLILGLSHYEIYKITTAALDAREKRMQEREMMTLAQSERTMFEAAALVVELCVKNGGDDCRVEVY